MAAKLIEPDCKVPKVFRDLIEYLKENDPMGECSLDDSNSAMSCRVGYQNAIRNIEKFIVEGEQAQTTQNLNFGDYASIEQLRYGCENEPYTHKVIGVKNSTHWVDVPVQTPAKETNHRGDLEGVVQCVCCGVDESKVLNYKIGDVVKL